MWNRKAAFAGTFYPADKEELGKLIDYCLDAVKTAGDKGRSDISDFASRWIQLLGPHSGLFIQAAGADPARGGGAPGSFPQGQLPGRLTH
jgi:predicted class III extradiol MEMO1 family dioxygenase